MLDLALQKAVRDATGVDSLQPAWQSSKFADYATACALKLAGTLGQKPRDLAAQIASNLTAQGLDCTVSGPGYINITLANSWYHEALAKATPIAIKPVSNQRNILLEMISANPTGPLTIGAARNGALADSLGRIWQAVGHTVEREYYFNDQGRQIDLLGKSLVAICNGEDVPDGGYAGEYMDALKNHLAPKYAGAPAADWAEAALEILIHEIKQDVASLNINIDTYTREGTLNIESAIATVLEHTYTKDGALWLKTAQHGDTKDRVIVRENGQPTYFAADISYMIAKYARGYDMLVYVLGADHAGYVDRLKAVSAILGQDPESIRVVLYQLVTISGKRQGKRLGNITTVRETLNEAPADALRYYLVRSSHYHTLDINLDMATAQTKENPVYYVQYAHARICSLLQKAGDDPSQQCAYEFEQSERALIRHIASLEDLLHKISADSSVHLLADWLHILASLYHVVHHDLPVLKAQDDARLTRLALARAVKDHLAFGLDLLGISAPEKM